jgi:hypothetical protein
MSNTQEQRETVFRLRRICEFQAANSPILLVVDGEWVPNYTDEMKERDHQEAILRDMESPVRVLS